MELSILVRFVKSCIFFRVATVSDESCLSTHASKSKGDCDQWDFEGVSPTSPLKHSYTKSLDKSLEQVQLSIHLVAMVMDEDS